MQHAGWDAARVEKKANRGGRGTPTLIFRPSDRIKCRNIPGGILKTYDQRYWSGRCGEYIYRLGEIPGSLHLRGNVQREKVRLTRTKKEKTTRRGEAVVLGAKGFKIITALNLTQFEDRRETKIQQLRPNTKKKVGKEKEPLRGQQKKCSLQAGGLEGRPLSHRLAWKGEEGRTESIRN